MEYRSQKILNSGFYPSKNYCNLLQRYKFVKCPDSLCVEKDIPPKHTSHINHFCLQKFIIVFRLMKIQIRIYFLCVDEQNPQIIRNTNTQKTSTLHAFAQHDFITFRNLLSHQTIRLGRYSFNILKTKCFINIFLQDGGNSQLTEESLRVQTC